MLVQVMAAGKINTVKLSDKVTTGRQQWLQWHAAFADELPALRRVRLSTKHCCMAGSMWPLLIAAALACQPEGAVTLLCPDFAKHPWCATACCANNIALAKKGCWLQEDEKMLTDMPKELDSKAVHTVQVVRVKNGTSSLEVWEPLCGDGVDVQRRPLLLMTHEFNLLNEAASLREMAELMYISDQASLSCAFAAAHSSIQSCTAVIMRLTRS